MNTKKGSGVYPLLKDLLAKPQLDISSPLSTSNRLADRHFDSLEDSALDIRRTVKTPGVGSHALTNYLVKIAGLEGELQGLKREFLSIDDCEGCKDRASWIKHSLFDVRVTISRLTEEQRKNPLDYL